MKNRVLSLILTVALLITFLPLGALRVHAVNEFTISDEMLGMLKEFEGFSAKPYWDYGQWTVGYGTRAPAEHLERYQNEGISHEEAEELLRDFLTEYGDAVNNFANKRGLTLTQGQFDALLSLSFNCGPNWMNEESTFRSAVLEGRTGNDFLFAMGQWSTAGGEVQKGLVRRRLIEINMYLNGIYSMDVPSNYDYVLYDANGGERDVKVQCYDSVITAAPISVPTYEGHTFLGWYTAAEGGEKIEVLDESVSGFKLYAHWSQDTSDAPETPDAPVAPETPDTPDTPGTPDEITGTPVDQQRVVTADSISALEQPVSGAKVVSMVKKDTLVQIVAEYTDENGTKWGKLKDGGWIDLTGTKLFSWEDAEADGVKVKVTAYDVNIRKGPGTNYSRVGSVTKGDEMIIIATASGSGYIWGQYRDGWIALKYTNYDEVVNGKQEEPVPDETVPEEPVPDVTVPEETVPEETVPEETVPEETVPEETVPQEPAPPAPEEEKAWKGIVTSDDGLRIRAQAGTSYAIVGYLRYQQEVKILERKTVDGRPWGRMEKGWVCLDYVKLEDSTGETNTPNVNQKPTVQSGTITGSNLRIRSGPSTAYQILGYLQIGDRVEITETVTNGTTQWGKTAKGWISMDYVKITGAVETPDDVQKPDDTQKPDEDQNPSGGQKPDQEKPAKGRMGTITGNALRIRSGAGTNHEIIGFLYTGDRVEILEQKTVGSTTWGRIAKGWISMDYVKLDAAQQEQKLTATVKEGNLLRVRISAGSDFTIVGYLYGGDTVEILERKIVDGNHWGRCEKGWINLAYVTLSDGSSTEPEVGNTTITGTVTATVLNVRKAAGVGNQIVSVLYRGDKVVILETTVVGSTTWGRTAKGWISMDYVQ